MRSWEDAQWDSSFCSLMPGLLESFLPMYCELHHMIPGRRAQANIGHWWIACNHAGRLSESLGASQNRILWWVDIPTEDEKTFCSISLAHGDSVSLSINVPCVKMPNACGGRGIGQLHCLHGSKLWLLYTYITHPACHALLFKMA